MRSNYLNGIFHPEFFQGCGRKPGYFEGWYFKHENRNEGYSYAFIPGISNAPDDPHSFVQLIHSNAVTGLHFTKYFRYPSDKFEASSDMLDIRVGPNRFTKSGCSLSLADPDGFALNGEIAYGPFTPIKKSVWKPGIMGPFAYIPNMECNHGVVSMAHDLSGSINDNGVMKTFENGGGYIEKDWGHSFPRKYLWVQSPGFMLSIADVPFLGMYFSGFFCIFMLNGIEYRFATYAASKITTLRIGVKDSEIVIKKFGGLSIRVQLSQKDSGGQLMAPQAGKMGRTINESLSDGLNIRLIRKGIVLFDGSFNQAAVDSVGMITI